MKSAYCDNCGRKLLEYLPPIYVVKICPRCKKYVTIVEKVEVKK